MTIPSLPLDPAIVEKLSGVTTATLTTVLLKKGLRNVWMRGTQPLKPGQPRVVGRVLCLLVKTWPRPLHGVRRFPLARPSRPCRQVVWP